MIDSGSYSQWILDSSKRFSGCFGVSSGYPMTTIENGWMFSGSLNISLMASIGLVIGVAPHQQAPSPLAWAAKSRFSVAAAQSISR